MKEIIVDAVNLRDFSNSKSPVLLEMIYEDMVTLLRFIHRSQAEGLLTQPFCFTNQINYMDSFWHHFILHTRLYLDFCQKEFGEYLHHEPGSSHFTSGKKTKLDHPAIFLEQMEILEKSLGQEYVNRIYFLYPELLK
jgi:hypothetical protein